MFNFLKREMIIDNLMNNQLILLNFFIWAPMLVKLV